MYKAEMIYNSYDAGKFFRNAPKSPVRKCIDGFVIGIGILMIIFSLLVLAGGAPLWYLAVYWITLLICLLPYYIYVFCIFVNNSFLKPDKLLNSMKKYDDATVTYKFFYYEFNVQFGKDKNIAKKSIEYIKLIYAVETREYFFLYESRKSGYIIRKNSFTEGNPWEVSKVLKTHLGSRFVCRVKG